ncbi:MAG TPA: zinc ribbon domain-containing protein [Clostridia bacterium]|nr:zinc ribbon domain-containing protein [Clostridia bacterium]
MFQQQRRGLDELNRTMLIAALVLSIIGMIVSQSIGWLRMVLSLLSGALLVLIVIRMMSKNFNKRNQENMKYLTYETAVKDWFRRTFRAKGKAGAYQAPRAKRAGKNPTWAELKQYKYLICPQCAQRLRVPRGKGRIRVTCTNCSNVFETRS